MDDPRSLSQPAFPAYSSDQLMAMAAPPDFDVYQAPDVVATHRRVAVNSILDQACHGYLRLSTSPAHRLCPAGGEGSGTAGK